MVPIFLATLAVRQQSQVVRFESAAELLDTFGLAKGGKEYRRLIAEFERIFGATIFSARIPGGLPRKLSIGLDLTSYWRLGFGTTVILPKPRFLKNLPTFLF